VVDYDEEHFSAEPEFSNPTYAVDDPDLQDVRSGSYYVNVLHERTAPQALDENNSSSHTRSSDQ
jgi:hypothetical protein